MIVSEARIAANRRNSLKSTGPKTPEGKERSRANALKHGLCSSIVVAEDLQLVQQRCYEWYYTLKPQNEFHSWLCDKIAIYSIRIDRCERMERRVRDRKSLVAEVSWDDDRRLQAANLGGQLSRRPDAVVEELRRTPQGCEWLMTRWAMLAHSADEAKSWTPDQNRLAFDLLGTPPEFREGRNPGASLDFDGRVIATASDPAVVARREIDALKERREVVAGLDEVDQALAEADLTDDAADPELRRLRRYESALHRRLRWCMNQLHFESPFLRPHPDLKPNWIATIEPESELASEAQPKPEPKPEAEPESKLAKRKEVWEYPNLHPPFDIEPHEVPIDGKEIDILDIVTAREVKRLNKAEARREARRRKLERLRQA